MIDVAWMILGLVVLAPAGAIAANSAAGRITVYGGSAIVCMGFVWFGFAALTSPVQRVVLPLGLPWIGTNLRLDALSGFFLLLVGIGGAGASLFALGDARQEARPGRVLPFYPTFLAAMAMVVVADDAFTFVFAWELMSLTSWLLVMAHQQQAGNAGAGFVYLTMATFSGLVLLLAFGLLASAQGAYAFDSIRDNPPGAAVAAVVLIVALIGAGSKAGLVPLHVWLPLAHPAAPSHVSALMSGVMTKVAIYGFVRIVFDLLAPAPWWAASLVLVLGGITAVLGVLHAL
ncbi:MAG: hydrogenase 4 subunit B, partial [Pseudomonadota bacterium]|nr:hydrogenase 4 subunit B [Pseudomonadota bacterium]